MVHLLLQEEKAPRTPLPTSLLDDSGCRAPLGSIKTANHTIVTSRTRQVSYPLALPRPVLLEDGEAAPKGATPELPGGRPFRSSGHLLPTPAPPGAEEPFPGAEERCPGAAAHPRPGRPAPAPPPAPPRGPTARGLRGPRCSGGAASAFPPPPRHAPRRGAAYPRGNEQSGPGPDPPSLLRAQGWGEASPRPRCRP